MTYPVYPRYAASGTDRAIRVHSEERMVGARAPFHVFHRSPSGKGFFDVAYTKTADEAAAFILANLPRNSIVGVLPTEPVDELPAFKD